MNTPGSISRYIAAISTMKLKYPDGITKKQAIQICTQVGVNNTIINNLIRCNLASAMPIGINDDKVHDQKYLIVDKPIGTIANLALENQREACRKRVKEHRATKNLPSFRKVRKCSDSELIDELKSRGYEIQKTVTKIIKY